MSGYIALHRDAFEHPLLRDAERFKAWFWLVSRACWKETRYDIRGKTVTLQRGQLCTSRTQLSEELGWSQSAVERFLTRLETEQMIGRATGQGKSIVTICNYDKYQQSEDETGQATGQATGQKSDRNRTAKEEGKERKKEDNSGGYAFCGSVIRLNADHFRQWQEAFHLLDLTAQLTSRDAWLSGQDDAAQKRWFNSTAAWLANKQQEARGLKERANDPMANFIT